MPEHTLIRIVTFRSRERLAILLGVSARLKSRLFKAARPRTGLPSLQNTVVPAKGARSVASARRALRSECPHFHDRQTRPLPHRPLLRTRFREARTMRAAGR